MPDPVFENLYRDTEHLAWAPTEQVRSRGRQRARRTAVGTVLASAVAVAVVIYGAVALAGRPDLAPVPPPATNSPTPSATPTPSPSSPPSSGPPTGAPTGSPDPATETPDPRIPRAAMLQAADLPDNFQRVEVGSGDLLALAAENCDAPNWRSLRMPVSAERFESWIPGADGGLTQQVQRHAGDGATRFMDQVSADIESCTGAVHDLSVVDSGFAGDESLLVNFEQHEGIGSLYVLVRQGDLISVTFHSLSTERAPASYLADLAADRLCAGTDAC